VALTVEQIHTAGSDAALLDLLLAELGQQFPPELRDDPVVFLSRLHAAPCGLRAMACTYELDVSMALDDLAWHFVNHHGSFELAEETIASLNELETPEAAEIFRAALVVIKPHWNDWHEVAKLESGGKKHHWLDSKGIQELMNPLNDRMWNYLKQFSDNSFFSVWMIYARKYPERCCPAHG
jgi:hypothetical protein